MSTDRHAATADSRSLSPQLTNKTVRQLAAVRIDELNDCRKLAKAPLYEATMAWLETRKPFVDPRTVLGYTHYLSNLTKFFGNIPLEKLANPDLLRAYQLERSKRCCAGTVNKELSLVQQLLKRIRKWNEVSPYYDPLPLSGESPGRAMTPDEERRLLEAGSTNPNWAPVYNLTILSMNTAGGPDELMGLRFRDVYTEDPQTARIYIREHVKNDNRVREVPLNADALTAVKALLLIGKSRGAGLPDHYLVPFRNDDHSYDPTKPGKWPRAAWREMCATAGIRLRPYDLRHHGLTKLAEKNPEQVVLKIGGHVSPQMLRRIYAHVRLPALRSAVDSISSVNRPRPAGQTKKAEANRSEETLFRVAKLAEYLGVPNDKAVALLLEYERQQAFGKAGNKNE
jgi:integrase